MKFSCMLFAFLSLINVAMADRLITFLFDNTTAATQGLSCTANDTALMAPIFDMISYENNRRQLQLRSSMMSTDNHVTNATTAHMGETFDHRGLQRECENRCKHVAGGWCHPIPLCRRRRRVLQDNSHNFNPLYATCDNHLAEMNKRLDELIATSTAMTEGCKILIGKNHRNATCEDGIVSGEIESFTVNQWQQYDEQRYMYVVPSKRPIAGQLPKMSVTSNTASISGSSSTLYTTKLINIRANLIPCVTKLEFSIVGPRINSHRIIDMSTTTATYADALKKKQIVYAGTYTITAIPDNNVKKAKSFTLTVI